MGFHRSGGVPFRRKSRSSVSRRSPSFDQCVASLASITKGIPTHSTVLGGLWLPEVGGESPRASVDTDWQEMVSLNISAVLASTRMRKLRSSTWLRQRSQPDSRSARSPIYQPSIRVQQSFRSNPCNCNLSPGLQPIAVLEVNENPGNRAGSDGRGGLKGHDWSVRAYGARHQVKGRLEEPVLSAPVNPSILGVKLVSGTASPYGNSCPFGFGATDG